MHYFLPSEWTVSMFFKRTFSGSLTIKVLQFLSLTVCGWHSVTKGLTQHQPHPILNTSATNTMLKQLPNGTMLYLPYSVDEYTARQRMEAYAKRERNMEHDGRNLFDEMFSL